MNARLLWVLLGGLMVPGVAGAQGAGTDAEEAGAEEGGDEGEDKTADPATDEGPTTPTTPTSEAATAPLAPDPATSEAATTPAAPEPAADSAPAEPEAPSAHQRMKAHLGKMPQLQFSWGGFQLAVFDPGFGAVSDVPRLESFHASLDVWVHPNLSVAVSWSDSGEKSDGISAPNGSSLRAELEVRSFDVAARALLAPRWMPLRPIARVGVGVLGARYSVVDESVDGNLRGRQSEAATPYLRLGLGLELTSPRYGRDAVGTTEPRRVVRWGLGGFVEGGAMVGGGGAVPAAPSLNFGAHGRLDLGPFTLRAGGTVFF